ncbi:MAG: hypothetical protein ACYTEX_26895 [Planctomycetota bacterium]|jgi:hypothetical protein
MKRADVMKVMSVVVVVLALLSCAQLMGKVEGPRFERVGPAETARLEKTLWARLGVYAWGIWPSSEKLKGGIPSSKLPERYLDRSKTWLGRILKEDLLPEVMEANEWRGLRKANGYNDFIVGQWRTTSKTRTVKFRATGLLLVVTVVSEEYFPNGVSGLTDDDIIKAITDLVNYPEDKIKEITIEKQFEEMGEPNKKALVCYGKLRAPEPALTPPPKRRARPRGTKPESTVPEPPRQTRKKGHPYPTWWSHMPFWMTKNKIFFCSSMVNWETFPATLDPYVFKFPAPGKSSEKTGGPKK